MALEDFNGGAEHEKKERRLFLERLGYVDGAVPAVSLLARLLNPDEQPAACGVKSGEIDTLPVWGLKVEGQGYLVMRVHKTKKENMDTGKVDLCLAIVTDNEATS